MINYVVICVLVIFYSNAEEYHNVFVKGSTDYKVEYFLSDDDIEMVSKDELIPFQIDDKINKFNELNKICEREYNRTLKARSLLSRYYNHFTESKVFKLSRHSGKRFTSSKKPFTKRSRHRRQVDFEGETENDNNTLAKKYDTSTERITEKMPNKTYHAVETDSKALGLMARLKSIIKLNMKLEENFNQKQTREVIAQRVWNISQIWLIVYIIVAIPLWCTLGWCCCCLCCKCFKAHKTIDDARKYLKLNPPGILRDRSGDIIYEPTDKEKEAYEELDHLIKTL